MLRPYELGIAFRYLRSRNRNRFISFISLISVFGIAIAVAVLIVVLSVMNGFELEVRDRILKVVSHGAITGIDGRMDDWTVVRDIADNHDETLAVVPFVSGQGMLVGASEIKGVEISGIQPDAEQMTSGLAELVERGDLGSLTPGKFRIAIGRALAETLDVSVGDKAILMIAEGVITPAGMVPRMRRFEISAIFYAGMYEYDRGLVLMNVEDAARLFRLRDAVSGVRFSLRNPMSAPATVREIAQSLGRDVLITDWTRQHANFFRSIQLTKSIVFVILLLVVAVAAFNIISTLVLVVREKRPEIAILRTLGTPPSGVLSIFMAQGTFIGLIGTALGATLGILLSFNISQIVAGIERLLGFRFLAPDIYFISDFPSRIDQADVIQVCLIAVVLAFLSTVYPAWRGAIIAPARALRHE